MDEKTDKCIKCGKPKTTTGVGLVTKYIEVCQCELIANDAPTGVIKCSKCGLEIKEESKGSLTQWIFQSGYCQCDKPEPIEDNQSSYSQPVFAGYAEDEDEEVLELDADLFPVERYKPLKVLGRGANGSVYLCRDALLGTKVAVKVLVEFSNEQLVSFQDEAKSTSKLDHPNIIKVLDFGVSNNTTPYMVLEFFESSTLEEYLKSHEYMDSEEVCNLISQVAGALDYAHTKGIYHRDIKPSNILIRKEDDQGIEARIIDFGLAKVLQESSQQIEYQSKTLAGTPGYMSPDQFNGYGYDERSEVYSLGCIFFETLVGKKAFTGDIPTDIVARQINDEIPLVTSDASDVYVSDDLQNLVSSCLSPDPEDRPQSMQEMIERLNSLDESEAVSEEDEVSVVGSSRRVWVVGSMIAFMSISAICLTAVYLVNPDVFLKIKEVKQPKKSKKPKKTEIIEQNILGTIDDKLSDISKSVTESTSEYPGYRKYIVRTEAAGGYDFRKIESKDKVHLRLIQSQLSLDVLKNLLAIRNLKILELSSLTQVNRSFAQEICKKKDLEGLEISFIHLTENDFALLEKNLDLQILSVFSGRITFEKAQEIAKMKSLKYLKIMGDKYLTEKSVIYLAEQLKDLRALKLDESHITDKAIKPIAKLKHLSMLSLYRVEALTDRTVSTLVANDSPVRVLIFSDSRITKEGIFKLNELKNIKAVYVGSMLWNEVKKDRRGRALKFILRKN